MVQEKLDEAENLISVLKEKFQNDKNVSEFEKKLNELKEKQTPVENLDENSENSFEDDDKSNLSSWNINFYEKSLIFNLNQAFSRKN